MENEDEDSQRKGLKANGRNFSGENSAQEVQSYNSNTPLLPTDVIGCIITFCPYPWLSISKYFRTVSLRVLPLSDKHKVMLHCCARGYLDLLDQITVKYG